MDNAAREHLVNTPLGVEPVVMVGIVVADDAIVAGTVGGRVPGPCSAVEMTASRATDSSCLPSTEWLSGWGTSGMSSLPDSMSLESFVLYSIGASMQFTPYGRT